MKLKLKYVKLIKRIIFLLLLILIIIIASNVYKNLKENKTREEESTRVEEKNKEAKITIVGDFLYEEPYYNALNEGENIDKYFSSVKNRFQEDDLSLGNMEVVIGNDNLKYSGSGFSFCAPPKIGHQIIDLGMDVLATANNHSNDRGLEGRISTIDFFKEKSDILTVGTYKKNERDVTNNIKKINGIKFGFLSYTYGTNVKVDETLEETIGLYKNPKTGNVNKELLKEEISNLRKQVDVLIVFMHWGKEFTYEPTSEQKELAKYFNSLKVDIIIGTHSHSIEPIEWINTSTHETLVYYSLGNFVSADEDISRTGQTFDNAYQFGLLSNLLVTLENDEIYISNIDTEIIVNYYDKNFKNFMLIPLENYTENYETTHYRYNQNLTKDFIQQTYEKVIDENYR